MTKKITKKEYYENLIRFVSVAEDTDGNKADYLNFLNRELERLAKQSANHKPTKKQVANENIKDRILELLEKEDKPMSITQIFNSGAFPDVSSTQKLSALLTQLKNSGAVQRTVEKKTPMFAIAKIA